MSIFLKQLLKQCRKPTGLYGRFLAWEMNSGHAELTDWGLKQLSIEKHYTILDVGCGGGRTVDKLAGMAAEGKVYGIDFSEDSLAVARRRNRQLIQTGRVEIRQASVSDLPFEDNTFDLASAVETHYFWPNLAADMQEILRVLKPGGQFILLCEAYKGGKYEERNLRWVKLGNMAYHSRDEFSDLFTSAGYTDVQVFEEYDKGWMGIIGRKSATMSCITVKHKDRNRISF